MLNFRQTVRLNLSQIKQTMVFLKLNELGQKFVLNDTTSIILASLKFPLHLKTTSFEISLNSLKYVRRRCRIKGVVFLTAATKTYKVRMMYRMNSQ